jgi:hypothetical protein
MGRQEEVQGRAEGACEWFLGFLSRCPRPKRQCTPLAVLTSSASGGICLRFDRQYGNERAGVSPCVSSASSVGSRGYQRSELVEGESRPSKHKEDTVRRTGDASCFSPSHNVLTYIISLMLAARSRPKGPPTTERYRSMAPAPNSIDTAHKTIPSLGSSKSTTSGLLTTCVVCSRRARKCNFGVEQSHSRFFF